MFLVLLLYQKLTVYVFGKGNTKNINIRPEESPQIFRWTGTPDNFGVFASTIDPLTISRGGRAGKEKKTATATPHLKL